MCLPTETTITTCHSANQAQSQLTLCASLLQIPTDQNVDMQQECYVHCPATMLCLLS